MPTFTYTTSSRGGFFTRTVVLALAVMMATILLNKGIHINSDTSFGYIATALGTAIVIAFLDNIVRPILLVVTFPFTIISMGLFVFVINAIIIEMADGLLGKSFEVDSFGWALLFSLIITIVNYILEYIRRKVEQEPYEENNTPHNDDPNHFDEYEEVD